MPETRLAWVEGSVWSKGIKMEYIDKSGFKERGNIRQLLFVILLTKRFQMNLKSNRKICLERKM